MWNHGILVSADTPSVLYVAKFPFTPFTHSIGKSKVNRQTFILALVYSTAEKITLICLMDLKKTKRPVRKPCQREEKARDINVTFRRILEMAEWARMCVYSWISSTKVLQSSTPLWHHIRYHKSIDANQTRYFRVGGTSTRFPLRGPHAAHGTDPYEKLRRLQVYWCLGVALNLGIFFAMYLQ